MTATASALAAWRRWQPLHDRVARDIHPERWAMVGIDLGAAKRLTECGRSLVTLSRNPGTFLPALSAEWLRPEPPAELDDWMLFPGGILWRTALRFGAGCFYAAIAGVMLRRDVDTLKTMLGDDAYRFAVRQAPLLKRKFPEADDVPPPADAEELGKTVMATAGQGLASAIVDLPPDLAGRILLKLPPFCDGCLDGARGWPRERREQWAALYLGLLDTAPAPGT